MVNGEGVSRGVIINPQAILAIAAGGVGILTRGVEPPTPPANTALVAERICPGRVHADGGSGD